MDYQISAQEGDDLFMSGSSEKETLSAENLDDPSVLDENVRRINLELRAMEGMDNEDEIDSMLVDGDTSKVSTSSGQDDVNNGDRRRQEATKKSNKRPIINVDAHWSSDEEEFAGFEECNGSNGKL